MTNCYRCGKEVYFDKKYKRNGKWIPMESRGQHSFIIHQCNYLLAKTSRTHIYDTGRFSHDRRYFNWK